MIPMTMSVTVTIVGMTIDSLLLHKVERARVAFLGELEAVAPMLAASQMVLRVVLTLVPWRDVHRGDESRHDHFIQPMLVIVVVAVVAILRRVLHSCAIDHRQLMAVVMMVMMSTAEDMDVRQPSATLAAGELDQIAAKCARIPVHVRRTFLERRVPLGARVVTVHDQATTTIRTKSICGLIRTCRSRDRWRRSRT